MSRRVNGCNNCVSSGTDGASKISMKHNKLSVPMGRPRSFDLDEALDRALQVFWRKGYEGTSLSDLTKAVGVNRPSLYAAFGDKKALFRKVLDRYLNGPAAYTLEALKEPPAQPRGMPHSARRACLRRGSRFHPPGTGSQPRGG